MMELYGYYDFVVAIDIKKEDIKHLAGLARIELGGNGEGILRDAENILEYFKELKELDTRDVSPMAGATDLVNRAEEDIPDEELIKKGTESFPETEKGFLKVPGVMKRNNQ